MQRRTQRRRHGLQFGQHPILLHSQQLDLLPQHGQHLMVLVDQLIGLPQPHGRHHGIQVEQLLLHGLHRGQLVNRQINRL